MLYFTVWCLVIVKLNSASSESRKNYFPKISSKMHPYSYTIEIFKSASYRNVNNFPERGVCNLKYEKNNSDGCSRSSVMNVFPEGNVIKHWCKIDFKLKPNEIL